LVRINIFKNLNNSNYTKITFLYIIIPIASAFIIFLISYTVLSEPIVVTRRFSLSLAIVATILVGTLVLDEKLTLEEKAATALILVGIV